MKKVRIFTPCWGILHAARLQRALVRSLAWPQNAAALKDNVVEWRIFTRQVDAARIKDILAPLGFPITITVIDVNKQPCPLIDAARSVLRDCRDDGSMFMTAFPDIVFGDGSIRTMMELAQQEESCVIAPHIRVTPNFMPAMTDPMFGPSLVTTALAHAHSTWTEACSKRRVSNTFYGGVSWEQIGDLYYVRHSLPNPWIANITASDIEWFDKEPQWGTYDHNWPAKIMDEGRAVIVGSSDAAFIVEVTDQLKNNANLVSLDPQDPDKFYRKEPHHKDLRSYVTVFRPQ